MVSDTHAYVADKIRKLSTLLLSAGGTFFLLRVLYRSAQGTQHLLDPELFAFIAIALVAVFWIRATRRMPRRAMQASPEGPDQGVPPGATSSIEQGSDVRI